MISMFAYCFLVWFNCPTGKHVLQAACAPLTACDRLLRGGVEKAHMIPWRGVLAGEIPVSVHPGKLIWNPQIGGLVSMRFLFQGDIFRFHVCLQGCSQILFYLIPIWGGVDPLAACYFGICRRLLWAGAVFPGEFCPSLRFFFFGGGGPLRSLRDPRCWA